MGLRLYVFVAGCVGLLVWGLSLVNFPFIIVPVVLFFGGLMYIVIKEGR